MQEIRITFRGEDFAAVSEKLVALGVTFQVEPLGGDEQAGGRAAAVPRPGGSRKKATAKKASPERPHATASGGAADAAARLRAMAERNRAAGGRAADEPGETAKPSPFDAES